MLVITSYLFVVLSTFNNMLVSTGRSHVTEVNNAHAVFYTEDVLLELTSAEFSNTRNNIVATCKEL